MSNKPTPVSDASFSAMHDVNGANEHGTVREINARLVTVPAVKPQNSSQASQPKGLRILSNIVPKQPPSPQSSNFL
ncbi:MAG: hypothetical protein NTZ46_11015 [Verrucomicrobia bacterium]|nr:hypothetical protein [Verrucomicrobiota bacterium]